MNNAHVLLLEDDTLWVDSVREVIAPHVQSVHAATSLGEATALLDTHYFTVAIVDISLIGNDPKDSQGMEFLRMLADRKLNDVVSIIILSAYGDKERVRKAFRDFHVHDFLSKSEFNAVDLIDAISGALAAHKRLDDLTIELQSHRSLASLWERFDWPQRETEQELISELVDLLRRLFPGATELFLQPMTAGQSGAVVGKVEPIYGPKRGSPLIVKVGKRDKIEIERDNYDEHIERFISNQASTRLRYVPGRAMGAIAYSLVGPDLGDVRSLAEYFPKASVADLQRVFDNLFQYTCRRWYENREQPRRTRDLVTLYEQGLHIHHWDDIWQGMAQVTPDLAAPRLSFPGIEGDFPNPKRWLASQNHQIYLPVWLATTHGDLNEYNVLVTEDNRAWLIDFYRTGAGHILRDVIELECAIKFSLSGIVDLAAQQMLEEMLLSQSKPAQTIQAPDGFPFAKALEAIVYLRTLASDFTEHDMREYLSALLLHTLYLLSLDFLHERDAGSRARVLLSAAMIVEKLSAA